MAAKTLKYSVSLTDKEVQTFPEGKENQYTKRKTESCVFILQQTIQRLLHLTGSLRYLFIYLFIARVLLACWLMFQFLTFGKKKLDCTNALGMQSGAIPDIRVTASSTWNSYTGASLARLNLTERGNYSGGWVAGVQASSQYLQVVFGATDTVLTGIATQGREDADQWVKSYFLIYKNSHWHNYKETRGIAYSVSMIQASLSDIII